MREILTRRVLVAAAAITFAAGCSNNATSFTPGQSSLNPGSQRVVAGMRVLPGPVVSGPTLVPLVPRPDIKAPRGWPITPDRHHHRQPQLLFVSDSGNNTVYIYNPTVANGSPKGSITSGLNVPFQLAVDKASNLYVANLGGNTVTVYAKGASTPKLTISTGITAPYGVTVDSAGNVFVSNLNNNTITAYHAGQTSPYETISFSTEGQAVGIGVDSMDNVYVACDSTNAVFEIPKGSTTPKKLNLSDVNGPIGVSFGGSNQMYVSNFGASPSNVEVYAYNTTTPKATITTGIEQNGPTLNGLTHSNLFFQTNKADNVVGYKLNQTTPFSTLMGNSSPTGIASSPLVVK
jgi:hypothetical protein